MIRPLLAFLLLFCAAACGERAAHPPSPTAKPALWAVEDGRGAATGWLFGTIHALPDSARWETPRLDRVVDEAGVLVVEVRDLDPKQVATAMDRLARDEPGPPLAERLPSSTRRDLAALLEREGIDPGTLDGLESWAAALALSRMTATMPSANGADRVLLARFASRPVAELEGAADQLAIFDALPERDQRRLLSSVVAERGDPAADESALADAWLEGDLAQLESVARRGLLADPALYKALSADRNKAWLARIVPLLESGRRPLVAVGAAHMLGPDGLPALLAAQGYKVRRVQ